MKIVYLNPGGTIGGAEMCLLDILATNSNVSPLVILGVDGPLRSRVKALGIRCEVLPLPKSVSQLGDSGASGIGRRASLALRGLRSVPAIFRYTRGLGWKLRTERPDLVQTNGMKMHLLGAWSASTEVPVIWHLHDYLSSRAAMARLLRLASRPGIKGVAVSDSVASDARKTLGDQIPIWTIYNAVNLDQFYPAPADAAFLDRASGLDCAPKGTVCVGLVATFATWKGHDLFLQAAAKIPDALPVRFYIIGGPIYQSTGSQITTKGLNKQVIELGLEGRVGFVGHLDEPSKALRSLDIVVHASTKPEPFGRVIVEGMACGRAVVVMDEGGAAELFQNGVDAVGCPPRDADELAERIEQLIRNPEMRRRLGDAARRSAVERFDRTRLAAEWAAIYDRRPQNDHRDPGLVMSPEVVPRSSP